MPLQERRLELAMKYGLKIKGNPQNPAYNSVFNLHYKQKYNSPRCINSLAVDLDNLFNEANIDLSQIRPNFVPETPACYSKPFDIDFSLTDYPKSSTSDRVYQSKFRELKRTKFPEYQPF